MPARITSSSTLVALLAAVLALPSVGCAFDGESESEDQDPADVAASALASDGVTPSSGVRFPAPPPTTMYRKVWNEPVRWSIENVCQPSHQNSDDPIVLPGRPGATHRHEFFSNRITDAFTTIDKLIRSNQVTCNYPADQSSYWFPSAYQGGRVLEADHAKVYYKAGVRPELLHNIPTGLRMIAGPGTDARGNESSYGEAYWYSFLAPSEIDSVGAEAMITSPSGKIGLSLKFPDCWNGRDLDSADHRSHMKYSVGGAMGTRTCPSSHPVPLPQLSINVIYNTPGGPQFRLSSGDWTTMHGDYINAWNPDVLQGAINGCLKARLNCRSQNTGDLAERTPFTIRGEARAPLTVAQAAR